MSASQTHTGRVSIVGAGPGDPELITWKGLRLLREADIVLYDRLAPPALLEETRAGARLIDVGKRPGAPRVTQGEINDLLIRHALAGRRVVRLKGGDPFMFGRGGEEAIAAAGAGIPVEIVPGVTAGSAVPALAGVPVTHRGVSRAVAFVTAVTDWDHPANEPGAETQIDEVAAVGTICIFMGLSQLEAVASRLIALGRDPATPAMCVSNGCTPEQRVVVSTLGAIGPAVAAAGLVSPALTVVGDVVTLREQILGRREAVA